MDFKAQGEVIVRRKQNACTGFQQTIQPSKMYSEEEMKIKNIWVKKIKAANSEWRLWLNSIPNGF